MLAVFDIFGTEIYTYPLVLGLIWGLCYHLGIYLLNLKNIPLKKYTLFYFGIFLSSWIGAKVFYLFTLNMEVVKKASLSSFRYLYFKVVFHKLYEQNYLILYLNGSQKTKLALIFRRFLL